MRHAVLAAVALVVAAVPLATAQGGQPEGTPPDFTNGQENAFGSIAMEPYVEADGEPVPVEARITLDDVGLLGRATHLLVAFNLQSKDVTVERTRLTAGGQTLEPVREATVRNGMQRQQFFDPGAVAGAAKDGRVDLLLTGSAEAAANGQWHVGVLVIAFDSVWGTLRAADGGSAELYGFSLVMEHGAGGTFLAPFHGQGNEAFLLVPLFGAVLGSFAGGWLLVRAARDRRSHPMVTPPAPPPSAPLSAPPPFTPPPPRQPASPAPLASSPVLVVHGQRGPAPRSPKPERPLWEVDFGYRFDPQDQPTVAPAAPPAPPAEAPVPAEPPAPPAPRLPVQGPKLPPGMSPGPWRPTVLADEDAPAKPGTHPPKPAERPAKPIVKALPSKATARRPRPVRRRNGSTAARKGETTTTAPAARAPRRQSSR